MKSEILHRGPWQIPYKAKNVLCVDGKYRTARITGEPVTFFTIPAQVQVRGKTVSGFISHRHDTPEDVLSFWGFGRNNAAFFPTSDSAWNFIKNKIIPNERIDEYEIRDINGKWLVTFERTGNHLKVIEPERDFIKNPIKEE